MSRDRNRSFIKSRANMLYGDGENKPEGADGRLDDKKRISEEPMDTKELTTTGGRLIDEKTDSAKPMDAEESTVASQHVEDAEEKSFEVTFKRENSVVITKSFSCKIEKYFIWKYISYCRKEDLIDKFNKFGMFYYYGANSPCVDISGNAEEKEIIKSFIRVFDAYWMENNIEAITAELPKNVQNKEEFCRSEQKYFAKIELYPGDPSVPYIWIVGEKNLADKVRRMIEEDARDESMSKDRKQNEKGKKEKEIKETTFGEKVSTTNKLRQTTSFSASSSLDHMPDKQLPQEVYIPPGSNDSNMKSSFKADNKMQNVEMKDDTCTSEPRQSDLECFSGNVKTKEFNALYIEKTEVSQEENFWIMVTAKWPWVSSKYPGIEFSLANNILFAKGCNVNLKVALKDFLTEVNCIRKEFHEEKSLPLWMLQILRNKENKIAIVKMLEQANLYCFLEIRDRSLAIHLLSKSDSELVVQFIRSCFFEITDNHEICRFMSLSPALERHCQSIEKKMQGKVLCLEGDKKTFTIVGTKDVEEEVFSSLMEKMNNVLDMRSIVVSHNVMKFCQGFHSQSMGDLEKKYAVKIEWREEDDKCECCLKGPSAVVSKCERQMKDMLNKVSTRSFSLMRPCYMLSDKSKGDIEEKHRCCIKEEGLVSLHEGLRQSSLSKRWKIQRGTTSLSIAILNEEFMDDNKSGTLVVRPVLASSAQGAIPKCGYTLEKGEKSSWMQLFISGTDNDNASSKLKWQVDGVFENLCLTSLHGFSTISFLLSPNICCHKAGLVVFKRSIHCFVNQETFCTECKFYQPNKESYIEMVDIANHFLQCDKLGGCSISPPMTGTVPPLKPKVRIILKTGQLAQQECDVLVNSADYTLDLTRGFVAKSLLDAAGPQLQEECYSHFPEGIQYGEICVTNGYKLKCKRVYHGTIPSLLQNKNTKDMCIFVQMCLQQACKEDMESITFPALGTGNLKYTPITSATAMYSAVSQFIEKYQYPMSLKEVRFVIYDKDTKVLKVFQERQAKWEKEHGLNMIEPHIYITSDDENNIGRAWEDLQPYLKSVEERDAMEAPPLSQSIHQSERLGLTTVKKAQDTTLPSDKEKSGSRDGSIHLVLSEREKLSLVMTFEDENILTDNTAQEIRDKLQKRFAKCSKVVYPFCQTDKALLKFDRESDVDACLDHFRKKKANASVKWNLHPPQAEVVVDVEAVIQKRVAESLTVKDVKDIENHSGVDAIIHSDNSITLKGSLPEITAAHKHITLILQNTEKQIASTEKQQHSVQPSQSNSKFQAEESKLKSKFEKSRLEKDSQEEVKMSSEKYYCFKHFYPDFPALRNLCWNKEKTVASVFVKLEDKNLYMNCCEDLNKMAVEEIIVENYNPKLDDLIRRHNNQEMWCYYISPAIKIKGKNLSRVKSVKAKIMLSMKENPDALPSNLSQSSWNHQKNQKSRGELESASSASSSAYPLSPEASYESSMRNYNPGKNSDPPLMSQTNSGNRDDSTQPPHSQYTTGNRDNTSQPQISQFHAETRDNSNRPSGSQFHSRLNVNLTQPEVSHSHSGNRDDLTQSKTPQSPSGSRENFPQSPVSQPHSGHRDRSSWSNSSLEYQNPLYEESCSVSGKFSLEAAGKEDTIFTYHTNEGMEIQVYEASILDSKANCLVCQNTNKLENSYGLAKVIADKAGFLYQDDCKKAGESIIPDGYAVPLPVQRLENFKRIINVVMKKWSTKDSDECLDTLCHCIVHSLLKAQESRMKSVAFPAIGAGNSKYPKDQCYMLYVGAVLFYSDMCEGATSIEEIHFVDQDTHNVQGMIKAYQDVSGALKRFDEVFQWHKQTTEPTESPYPFMDKGRDQIHISSDLKIVILVRNLLSCQSDVLVCSEDEKCSGKRSLSKAILEKSGKTYKSKRKSVLNGLKVGDVKYTSPPNFLERSHLAIFHAVIPSYPYSTTGSVNKDFLKVYSHCINNILYKADDMKFKTLAMPLLVSVYDDIRKQAARRIVLESLNYSVSVHRKHNLQTIFIVDQHLFVTDLVKKEMQNLVEEIHKTATPEGWQKPRRRKRKEKIKGFKPEGKIITKELNKSLSGYPRYGTISLQYILLKGIQGERCLHPGKTYRSAQFTAYLPNSEEGQEVVFMLKMAFTKGFIFKLKTNETTMEDEIVFADIPHKIREQGGGLEGYPDSKYLSTVRRILEDKGISKVSGTRV